MGREGMNEGVENLLSMVPFRTCRWYVSPATGKCTIRKNRFRKEPNAYQRFFMRMLGRSDFINIHLDEQASYLLRIMNGRRDVRTLVEMVEKRFGRGVAPVEQRTSMLLLNMESNGFIRLKGVK